MQYTEKIKSCEKCKYFYCTRNYNYETSTCDTITILCRQREGIKNFPDRETLVSNTYDRDTGDEIPNKLYASCPINHEITYEIDSCIDCPYASISKYYGDNFYKMRCRKEDFDYPIKSSDTYHYIDPKEFSSFILSNCKIKQNQNRMKK